ncbi:motile sperm domain-containing protein 1-like [Coccinella septempunctata]|uniref:motile sperm domain-containing protein 1-like n=1 Tax=Coccinella septempunctata TaxID=41139 RepID=UPI001D07273E|nr:motile sperm domain-containing protein 1-like [Coccinella septempunctata]
MTQVNSIPVFVYPHSLKFILNGRANHKQLMTLYNPFDFPIKFKISCTAPSKYTLSDPDGYIAAKSSFDIVIKHLVPAISNCGTVDKFRVFIADSKTQKITGRQDIDTILLEYDDDGIMENQRDFHSINKASDSSKSRDISRGRDQFVNNDINKTMKSFVLFVTAVAMVALLMLPLKDVDEPNHLVPDYLYLSSSSKIGLAFLVGAISTYYLFSFHERSQTVNVIYDDKK